MSNIHEITLDVKKSGQTINEPIVVRTDDTDDIIEVHLKKDNQPYADATSATFYGTKQDLTVIANDPATVDEDIITYSIPKELANIGGKITNAYFMIDGKITTESFIITVLKTVNFLGESKDYIPGLNSLIDKWNVTSHEWTVKLNGLDQDIKNLSMSDMLKQKMDKALAEAKTDYMTTFNKSVDNLNNVVTDLTNKENIATDKGKELDTAIDKVNSSIADVNKWLTDVQNKILAANKDFTESQQKSVSDEIDKLKASIAEVQTTADSLGKQLNTIDENIKAINVPDLNAKVQSALDTAKTASDSAVGTNLLINTGDDNDVDHPVKLPNANISAYGSLSRTEEYSQVTAPPSASNEMGYRFCEADDSNMYNLNPGQTYTIQGDVSISKGDVMFRSQYQQSGNVWADYDGSTSGTLVSNSDSFVHISYTFKIPDNATSIFISWEVHGYDSTTILRFRRTKLEKGSIATDYSVSPEDISTSVEVQTAISNTKTEITNLLTSYITSSMLTEQLKSYDTTSDVINKIAVSANQTKKYAAESIKAIVGAAPETLDTIAELAAAVTSNKTLVDSINSAITTKADKTDVTTLTNSLNSKIVSISDADYKALETAGTVDPTKLYVTPEA